MSEPLKRIENQVGHRTKAERNRRERAEASLRRATRVNMRAPEWLGEEAREVFEKTKKRMRGLEVLDTADIDVLAMYADAVSQYKQKQRMVELAMKMLELQAARRKGPDGEAKGEAYPGQEEDAEADVKRILAQAKDAEVMMLQWSRVVLSYAEKLGISANARARLARKKATREEPDELEALLDEFMGAAQRPGESR